MNIFSSLLFSRAVALHRPLLNKIAQELRPKSHPEHDLKAQCFMKAADGYDDQRIDEYIEESICYYTHNDEPLLGLMYFCDKFGVARSDSFVTVIGALEFIAKHKQEIDERLTRLGF